MIVVVCLHLGGGCLHVACLRFACLFQRRNKISSTKVRW